MTFMMSLFSRDVVAALTRLRFAGQQWLPSVAVAGRSGGRPANKNALSAEFEQ
jgi:hypothetical protein